MNEYFNRWLKIRNISLRQLSKFTDIDVGMLSKYLSGKVLKGMPNDDICKRIAYGIDRPVLEVKSVFLKMSDPDLYYYLIN